MERNQGKDNLDADSRTSGYVAAAEVFGIACAVKEIIG